MNEIVQFQAFVHDRAIVYFFNTPIRNDLTTASTGIAVLESPP